MGDRGDRVYTTTTLRKDYVPLIVVDKDTELAPGDFQKVNDDLVEVIDEQANYGEMGWVTDVLDRLKIPYDLRWGQGWEFGEGSKYVRFDSSGEQHVTEVYDSTNGAIYIDSILRRIKDESLTTVDEVKDYLLEERKAFEIYGGQVDLAEIPLKELSKEESALIMKFKMEE
jgi:hypothetical protein